MHYTPTGVRIGCTGASFVFIALSLELVGPNVHEPHDRTASAFSTPSCMGVRISCTGVHYTPTCVHKSLTGVRISYTDVHISSRGCVPHAGAGSGWGQSRGPPRAGVYISRMGVYISRMGVHISRTCVYISRTGVHISRTGVCISRTGVLQALDLDGDGVVALPELEKGLSDMRLELTEVELRALLQAEAAAEGFMTNRYPRILLRQRPKCAQLTTRIFCLFRVRRIVVRLPKASPTGKGGILFPAFVFFFKARVRKGAGAAGRRTPTATC